MQMIPFCRKANPTGYTFIYCPGVQTLTCFVSDTVVSLLVSVPLCIPSLEFSLNRLHHPLVLSSVRSLSLGYIITLCWYKNHAFHILKIQLGHWTHIHTKAFCGFVTCKENYWKPMSISKELVKLIMVQRYQDVLCTVTKDEATVGVFIWSNCWDLMWN